MKVYRVREEIFRRAISRLEYNDDWKFEIFEMNDFFDKKNPRKYGINWSACGTQSVKNTQKFIEHIQYGIELAKMLNDMEIVLRPYDEKDYTISTKEDWEKADEYMTKWLKNKDLEQIRKFLAS